MPHHEQGGRDARVATGDVEPAQDVLECKLAERLEAQATERGFSCARLSRSTVAASRLRASSRSASARSATSRHFSFATG